MSRLDDWMIEGEDRPPFPFPARTLEAWLQLEAGLQVAEMVTLGTPPDWSALAAALPERTVGDNFVDMKTHGDDARGNDAQFAFYRAMTRAMNEGQATRDDWGNVRLADPIVKASLDAAEREETLMLERGSFLRCQSCLDAGKLETFQWPGALFIHLLTCPHFTEKWRLADAVEDL